MKQAGWLRSVYLTHFSHPAQDRIIYQTLTGRRVTSILELGVGVGMRTSRMLELVLCAADAGPLRYIGVDLFESHSDRAAGLTLKQAHQLLAGRGVSARLIPGDPYAALARTANNLGQVDLVVVSADQDRDSLRRAWFYLPRLLHKDSTVFVEEQGAAGPLMRRLQIAEVAALADAVPRPRRNAA